MTPRIRELDLARDRRGIAAIDTAFETESVFDFVTGPRTIELVERQLAEPLTKRYPIDELNAEWARWERGWVADDGEIRGVAVAGYEPWHERAVLWFLYIAPAWRRRGIGRALNERVEQYARNAGASHIWVETSTVNVPAVRAYNQLGYQLCGADRLLYGKDMPGESALYLAKLL